MKILETTKAPGAIGPYSQGYEINGIVYTSGQILVKVKTLLRGVLCEIEAIAVK
ncbi:hypothetical protein KQI88_04700 [Alkaliphilus sp. MSJ-5]|uniref:Uncharacterized protein n=1 Tax=Alkaliphilus flagellatus TaxID=2841507 RepID=A0ABS6G0I5_9FIRM|nr:hypothetical protein [Alkaliphilus flagellatus]MBU5675709.1 hypothetical protein [Alkaliphilus flagellatus]